MFCFSQGVLTLAPFSGHQIYVCHQQFSLTVTWQVIRSLSASADQPVKESRATLPCARGPVEQCTLVRS